MFKLFSELHKIFGMIKGFNSSYSTKNKNTMLISMYDGEKDKIYKVTFEEIVGANDIHKYSEKYNWN